MAKGGEKGHSLALSARILMQYTMLFPVCKGLFSDYEQFLQHPAIYKRVDFQTIY